MIYPTSILVLTMGTLVGISESLLAQDQLPDAEATPIVSWVPESPGEGELFGTDFTGPKELAAHISGDPKVGACATQNLFEFMMGRPVTASDETTLLALEGEYYETRSMHGIILAIVRSEGMIHRGGQ